MTNILLSVLIFLTVINLVLLVAVGGFLVQFRRNMVNLFGDFADLLERLFGTIPTPSVETDDRQKTWDEKYEEELEMAARRLKESSGLQDLPMNQEISWGSPPALNSENAKGLTIKDGTTNM